MRVRFPYCLFFLFLACQTESGFAQSCEMNMLATPNASSYAVIPNPKGISLPGAFTIEFWAQSVSFVPHAGLIEQVNNGNNGAFSIGFTSGSALIVTLHLNNGIVTVTSPDIQNIQNWQHYAVTFTPNDSIRIYINGILTTSQKTTAANLIASTDSILIAHSDLSGATFTGNMDELRFWNVAHTSAEILASMTTALSGNEAGLMAYYSFDDDPASPNIHDFTGRKSEGILISSASLAASTSPVTGTTGGYMLASKEQSVKFPDLICGSVADTIIHVYNRGREQVQIDPAAFQSGKIFSAATSVFLLPSDSTQAVAIRIQANPAIPGLYRDTLIVKSTTICGGILRIPVELRFDKISIAFEDPIFKLLLDGNDLLPCDLPLSGQTFLQNTGTRDVTVNSLQLSIPGDILITSPVPPFAISPGQIQQIKFTVLSGSAGTINTTLTARTNECSQIATTTFVGKRIIPQFSIPDHITFPDIHLPAPGVVVNMTITLQNTGSATLTANPPLSLTGGSGFRLLSPQSGLASLSPDSSLSIKIRFTTNECGVFMTALHFQDQKNCGIDTLIPLSINVLGPDVSPANTFYDLGASCGAHDTLITLVNKSGRTVVLGIPVFSKDSIVSLLGGTLPKSLDPGDSVSITIRFAPPEPGRYGVNASFPLSPCGESLLHFQGILGVGLIALSDSTLDFGNGCDLSPETRNLTITNEAGRQIEVTNQTLQGSPNFSLIDPPLPFTMGNNTSRVMTIQFTPQQLGSLEQSQFDLYDSGCFVTRFTVAGVRERFNISWSPGIGAEFGTICPGREDTATVILYNNGYGDDTVSSDQVLINSSVFHSANINGTPILHGAGKQFTVIFSPKDTGNYWDYLQVVLSPCSDTTRIALHGIGGPAATLSTTDSILDFKTIKVGTVDSLCTILQNPSCLALPISLDSIHGQSSVFSVSQNTRNILPDSIVDSAPLAFCFVFAPDKIGSFESSDTIRIGDRQKIITLRGSAGLSALKYDQRTIDFGDVLKDSIKKIPFAIHNNGSYPASLVTVRPPDPDFSHTASSQTVGGTVTSYDTIEFHPQYLGPQKSLIVYGWENHLDTIFLLGRGIEPGLSFALSLLDFSKRRVGHDSTIRIGVTNTLDTQIIIRSDSITGKYTVSPAGSRSIYPKETKTYDITYSPDAEEVDTASLYLVTDVASIAVLPIRGEGVEAHLTVDKTNIDFGNIGLQQTSNQNLKISNTGGYPLLINLSNRVQEFGNSLNGISVIPPDSSANYNISFTPQRAVTYFDTLHIDADAPEKLALVSLRGNGVFQPFGIPEVTYSIPDELAQVGDIVDIPISIGGKDLSLFNIDSFHVDITYDPTVIYFLDTIETDHTLSSGFTMKFDSLSHDSIIRISGRGNEIVATPGWFFVLRAMALLGPHDSTRISIQSSDPINTASLLSSSGSFVITDCENYRGGVLFKGNYFVSQVNPNPVSSSAHIDYEIGLPGRVHLDLFDALGRHVKTIVDDDQTVGKHSTTFSADDIPSGEYIYVFKSLEYESHAAMIIAK